MLKTLINLATIVFSIPAFSSGGTMVGNGGGFAEMQAVYLDHLLPKYLKNVDAYQDFLTSIDQSSGESLNFSSVCFAIDRDYVINNPFQIPSCLLYKTALDPKPKSLNEIGAIVFAFRWLAYDNNGTWETAFQKGVSLFSKTQISQRKISLLWRSELKASLIFWHIVTEAHQNLRQQVTLELPNFSLNLLPFFRNALNCSNELNLEMNYISLKKMNINQLHAVGPILWECQGKSFAGNLHLRVSEHSNDKVEVKLNILQKRPH